MNINRLNFSSFEKRTLNKTAFKGTQGEPEVKFHTKFLDLKEVKRENGSPWFYAHRPNARAVVVIAPISNEFNQETGKAEDYITFIETARPPLIAEKLTKTCIEFPAGLIGDEQQGETALEAANKELEEEIGCKADKVEIVAKNVPSSPGLTSETCNIAIATGVEKAAAEPVDDGGIIVGIHKVPLKKAMDWLKEQNDKGKLVSAQAYTGMALVLDRVMKGLLGKDNT